MFMATPKSNLNIRQNNYDKNLKKVVINKNNPQYFKIHAGKINCTSRI